MTTRIYTEADADRWLMSRNTMSEREIRLATAWDKLKQNRPAMTRMSVTDGWAVDADDATSAAVSVKVKREGRE